MRRKKQLKIAEETFWSNFFYFNIPAHLNEIPTHVDRVNFRRYGANDEDLQRMVTVVRSIYQLDLDETDITNEGLKSLLELNNLSEIRLKKCVQIDDEAMPTICQFKGLELLHLMGTAVTTDGFAQIGNLKQLKTLLISAERTDPKLEEIYANLAPNCKMIVNYKSYPFEED